MQTILVLNNFENLWNYPLTEIDHIVKNEINVVLVDVSDYDTESKTWVKEYRWFEVPKDFEVNYEE